MISLKKSPHAILQSFKSVSQCTQQVLDWALEQVSSRPDDFETSLDECPQLIDSITGALDELHIQLSTRPNDRKALAILSAAIGQLYAIRYVLVTVLLSGPGRENFTRNTIATCSSAFDRNLAFYPTSAQYDRLLAEEWLWQSLLFDPFGGSGIEGLRKLYIQTTIIGGCDMKNGALSSASVDKLIHSFGLRNLITGEVNFVDLREFDRTLLHLKNAEHLLTLNAALVSELSRISLFTGRLKTEGPPKSPTGIWPLIFLWILLRQIDGVGVHGVTIESLLLFLSSLIKILGNYDTVAPINTRFKPPAFPPTTQSVDETTSSVNNHSKPTMTPDPCYGAHHPEYCKHSFKFAQTVVSFIYMMIANVDTDKVGLRIFECELALLQLLEYQLFYSPRSDSPSEKFAHPNNDDNFQSQDAGPGGNLLRKSSTISSGGWTEEEDLMYYSILPALLCSCISVLPRTELKKKFAVGICLRRILRTIILHWNPENPLRLFLVINGIFYLIQKDGFFQDLALTGCENLPLQTAFGKKVRGGPSTAEEAVEVKLNGKPRRCRALRATRRCEMSESTSLDSLTLEHRQAETRLLADALIQTIGAFPLREVQFPATIAHIALPEDRWYYTHTADDLLSSPTSQGILQSDWLFDLVDSEAQLDSTQLRLIARAKKRVVSKCAYTPSKRAPASTEQSFTVPQTQEFQRSSPSTENKQEQPRYAEGMEFLISELPNALSLCRLRLNSQSGDANERQFERERRVSLLLTLVMNTLEIAAPQSPSMSSAFEKPVTAMTIVVDVANVAVNYGKQKWRTPKFDTEGVIKTINEIKRLGHHPICITSEEYVGGAAASAAAPRRFKIAENSESMLKQLHLDGELELTPPGDYDDGYIINFAMKKNACVLSNDVYRDQIPALAERSVRSKMPNHNHSKSRKCTKCAAEAKKEAEQIKAWLDTHLITYTFSGDDVIIDPTFELLPQG